MEESLCLVMEDLTEQIARDGEGATKLITIRVVGAADTESAVKIARSIGNSPLVKTAIAGSDPELGTRFIRGRMRGSRVRSDQSRYLHAGCRGLRQWCGNRFLRVGTKDSTR